jgi:hypothetical protein
MNAYPAGSVSVSVEMSNRTRFASGLTDRLLALKSDVCQPRQLCFILDTNHTKSDVLQGFATVLILFPKDDIP